MNKKILIMLVLLISSALTGCITEEEPVVEESSYCCEGPHYMNKTVHLYEEAEKIEDLYVEYDFFVVNNVTINKSDRYGVIVLLDSSEERVVLFEYEESIPINTTLIENGSYENSREGNIRTLNGAILFVNYYGIYGMAEYDFTHGHFDSNGPFVLNEMLLLSYLDEEDIEFWKTHSVSEYFKQQE